ncbi:MAG TPA: BamA/TamA family outer membrane protein [Bacteroidota bacterium]|nr:BamA/TamA family outer membrane protein [Bacteroidota bacterium]
MKTRRGDAQHPFASSQKSSESRTVIPGNQKLFAAVAAALIFILPPALRASNTPERIDVDSSLQVPDPPDSVEARHSKIEPLPIASYDTDVGVGYGAKCFFLDQLSSNESFDCTAFNSTKGERWYRFVFSIPDFELRQGKTYPAAVDLAVDYDKMIKNSFFGVGNRSEFSSREYYTREPLDVSITVSHGFSPLIVLQEGVRINSVRNYHFQDSSAFRYLPPDNSGTASHQSLFVNFRFDTRNSFINPSEGIVTECDIEKGVHTSFNNSEFTKLTLALQYYSPLFLPATVFAARFLGEGVFGNALPVQMLSSIGGNLTVRGSPQDRYLDNLGSVVNAEVRFPLYRRLGGVVGFDAGKVWNAFSDLDLARWAANPVTGLRLYMDTFVVRLDIGYGREATGVYFNFGQLF